MLIPVGIVAIIGVTPMLASAAAWTASGTGAATGAADSVSAPSAVSTTAQTSSTITLKVVTGPTSGSTPSSYRVDRTVGTSPGPAVGVCTIGAVGGTCDDINLSPSTNYSYVVRSRVGNNWVSAASGTIATSTSAAVTNTYTVTLTPSSAPQGSSGNWRATAAVTIKDQNGNLLSGFSISGNWTPPGSNITNTCLPATTGSCSIESKNIDSSTPSSALNITVTPPSGNTRTASATSMTSTSVNKPAGL
jgi:hypothetical protein